MTDDMELIIFAVILAAFVVCGCWATRQKRSTNEATRPAHDARSSRL
jgi:outer membrane murein-binding lipoprotein Lpp